MSKLLFLAETLSQWSVIRPLLPALNEFEIEVMCGPAVSAHPESDHYRRYPLFDVKTNTELRLHFNRIFTSEFNYKLYLGLRGQFRARLKYHSEILRRARTKAVVVGEDGISGEIWLIHAAKNLGIPVLILPYEASGREDFINVLRQKKRESNLVAFTDNQQNHLRKIGAASWMTEFEGQMAGIYNVEYITALHDLGIKLSNPWTTHGGEADILLSESPGMTQFYLDEGLSDGKIKETGSPYDDAVFAAMSAEPSAKSAYEKRRRIRSDGVSILVSLPPDYDSERGDISEFASYDVMRETVIRELGQGVAKLTIMVHPAYFDQVRSQGDAVAARFSKGWVLEQIPLHDIYITSGSSTLRWAAAARKVALNFDFYKFRLQFFDRLPGLRQFEDGESCFRFIRQLTGRNGILEQHMASSASEAANWAYFDGRCCSRIENILKEMTIR